MVKGVRGVVDRRHVKRDVSIPYIPSEHRRIAQLGDFELESFHVEDLLVTIYQPDEFRPYNIAIHFADMPRFRQQWVMYDIICARHIAGTFDNCLFSVFHAPGGQMVSMHSAFAFMLLVIISFCLACSHVSGSTACQLIT
jgi:distribution and morphology protein 31